MEKLTKQEAIRLHRLMWLWIAKETLKRKKKVYKFDYFDEMEIPFEDRPQDLCYCCEYDSQKYKVEEDFCKHCPLDWKSEIDDLICVSKYRWLDKKGLFSQWKGETDYKKCAELAREIANLKVRIKEGDDVK